MPVVSNGGLGIFVGDSFVKWPDSLLSLYKSLVYLDKDKYLDLKNLSTV